MYRLFYIFLFLPACNYIGNFHPVCPKNCYTGPEGTVNVGICKSGKTDCDENGFPTSECIGDIIPANSEICNNLDDDCDGQVDEYWEDASLVIYNTEELCKQEGVCDRPKAYCINGFWTCQYPPEYEIKEITCDGLDNDCDSIIDNIESYEACFDGEWIQATNPPCHPGIKMCKQEEWQCVNQHLPTNEICNHIDDNCDGKVDNNVLDNTPLNYDIVFIIDSSRSMCDYTYAIGEALNSYVGRFENDPYLRFALVLMTNTPSPLVKVKVPFGDLESIRDYLITMECNGPGHCEASLDSMYMVCDGGDFLNLDWKFNAGKMFFAFTDEKPQECSWLNITYQDVINNCLSSHVIPFIWGNESPEKFQYICEDVDGGKYFSLSVDEQDILNDLDSIIITLCGQ